MAASPAPRAPERSTGSWPTPLKKAAVRRPFTPGVVKYSAFAMKVTLRSRTAGRKKKTEKEGGVLARMPGPSAGVLRRPSTQGLKATFSGPPMATFIVPYNNRVPPVSVDETLTRGPVKQADGPGRCQCGRVR